MCAGEVYTVERIPELLEKARARLAALGLKNVHYRLGDGSEGWKAHAPYDRIITTAAAQTLPKMLISQLAPGGIAIAPVGPKGIQDLLRITKDEDGGVHSEPLGKVTFVELIGRYGWTED